MAAVRARSIDLLPSFVCAVACALAPPATRAGVAPAEVRVAVAANFKQTAGQLCDAYFSGRPGRCVLTSGSSGLLYAKVAQGAAVDVFLSADRQRAERLESDGLGVRGTRFTYAIGRLVLWRPHPKGTGADLRATLADPSLKTVAIAQPDSAPYGRAALQALAALGIDARSRFRLVQGESVAQAFHFVASGGADGGFVALSLVLEHRLRTGRDLPGEVLAVPDSLHEPIEQQAVLLAAGAGNAEARGLMEFMRSAAARRIIEAAGYASP